MSTIVIILAAIFVVLLYVMVAYNGLITLRNRVKEAWSDIDVQLKRRYDLIPNLIETVKGYASHEKETFDRVIEARNKAMSATGLKEKGEAENALSGTLKSLFALSESYPDLKASVNFLELQKELTDTEDKIQAARRFYNGNVMDFNTKLEMFPSNMIAQMFGFKASEFFVAEEGEKITPKVSF
ncbi:MAG TPA: LemA family protein [Candidatus Pacearchaeota archaeon]|nr:LemA family protein [Candidatus Pacearchaeota archaeon]HPR79653.1 LemA family protein [Candidatus Pacearchaeota archaeon]